jgi:polysaccharide biosynthesis/export protein
MFAIPHNRQSILDGIQSCGRTRLVRQNIRVAAVFSVLLGVSQCGWCQSNSTSALSSPAPNREDQTGVSKRESEQSGIHFVADGKHSEHLAGTESRVESARAPVTGKSTNVPPLSSADYANYINSDSMRPAAGTSLGPEPIRDLNNLTDESRLRVTGNSQTTAVGLRAADERVAVLAQEAEMPRLQAMPPDSRVESAPTQFEPLPVGAADSPMVPLTTSNYLAAKPESDCFRCGVKCPPCGCNPGGPGWAASRPIPWEVFAQGEYIGPSRLSHVPVYRLRVDDRLAFVYRLSGEVSGQPYRLNVRDHLQIQSLTAPDVVNREVIVEPDGTITLPLLGQVRAAGATLDELRNLLEEQFKREIRHPQITVTPLSMNSNLQEMRYSVDRRAGQGGQVSDARISPDGTVQLPAIGRVPAQGLTLLELEREIKKRYGLVVEGLEVTPILTARAPRYVYVVGEVDVPGRYTMEGPTSLMQAIALAGSWKVGAQLSEVIVFRRDENWQLMATKVNIRESLLFKKPCPSGEIWLRDSDIVLVPKSPILRVDDVINLVFTRGIYGVFPMGVSINFAKLSSI